MKKHESTPWCPYDTKESKKGYEVTTQELLKAIELWKNSEKIPETGEEMTTQHLLEVVDMWSGDYNYSQGFNDWINHPIQKYLDTSIPLPVNFIPVERKDGTVIHPRNRDNFNWGEFSEEIYRFYNKKVFLLDSGKWKNKGYEVPYEEGKDLFGCDRFRENLHNYVKKTVFDDVFICGFSNVGQYGDPEWALINPWVGDLDPLNPVTVKEVIAHECGHILEFGHCDSGCIMNGMGMVWDWCDMHRKS